MTFFWCNRRTEMISWQSMAPITPSRSPFYVVRWYYQDITHRTKHSQYLTAQSIRHRTTRIYIHTISWYNLTRFFFSMIKHWTVLYTCVTSDIVSFYKLKRICFFRFYSCFSHYIDRLFLKTRNEVISYDGETIMIGKRRGTPSPKVMAWYKNTRPATVSASCSVPAKQG